jgi:DNA-binding NarL/FixJ family response regulator
MTGPGSGRRVAAVPDPPRRAGEGEREVAVAVGRSLAGAEIAAGLPMSVATVKAHVSRALAELGLGNRVQLAPLLHDAGRLDDPAPGGPERPRLS